MTVPPPTDAAALHQFALEHRRELLTIEDLRTRALDAGWPLTSLDRAEAELVAAGRLVDDEYGLVEVRP